MSILTDIGAKIGTKIKELTTLIGTKLDASAKAVDSDKLDGLDSTKFVRNDINTIIYNHNIVSSQSSNGTFESRSGPLSNGLEIRSSSPDDAMMTFHVDGNYACHFGIDSSTQKLSVGGWGMGTNSHAIYHEGNKPTASDLNVMSGKKTISTSTPSGGSHGDIWIQV